MARRFPIPDSSRSTFRFGDFNESRQTFYTLSIMRGGSSSSGRLRRQHRRRRRRRRRQPVALFLLRRRDAFFSRDAIKKS
jgi:hypothetical protein